jgi:hypothetical protein
LPWAWFHGDGTERRERVLRRARTAASAIKKNTTIPGQAVEKYESQIWILLRLIWKSLRLIWKSLRLAWILLAPIWKCGHGSRLRQAKIPLAEQGVNN